MAQHGGAGGSVALELPVPFALLAALAADGLLLLKPPDLALRDVPTSLPHVAHDASLEHLFAESPQQGILRLARSQLDRGQWAHLLSSYTWSRAPDIVSGCGEMPGSAPHHEARSPTLRKSGMIIRRGGSFVNPQNPRVRRARLGAAEASPGATPLVPGGRRPRLLPSPPHPATDLRKHGLGLCPHAGNAWVYRGTNSLPSPPFSAKIMSRRRGEGQPPAACDPLLSTTRWGTMAWMPKTR